MGNLRLLTDDPLHPVLRLDRELREPPAAVWQSLTSPDRFREWLYCELTIDRGWRVGGAINFRYPPEVIDIEHPGEVLEVEEPHVLAYSYEEWRLRYELNPYGAGTRIVLVVEVPAVLAALAAATWDLYLDRLSGMHVPDTDWGMRHHRYASEFIPVLGAQEGPPMHLRLEAGY